MSQRRGQSWWSRSGCAGPVPGSGVFGCRSESGSGRRMTEVGVEVGDARLW